MVENVETCRDLAKKGLSCKKIANQVGQGYYTVYRLLKSEGLMSTRPRLPSEVRASIVRELRETSQSYSDIARRYTVNRSTVLRIAMRDAEEAEAEEHWSGEGNECEITFANIRKGKRCETCGRMITKDPCVACVAIGVQSATTPHD